ncbi:MAG TPA: two-component system response regulator [Cyanothece sp. UBA12306]|nr:two-component system response regulator [Cyanothece sp. UBA12306]
MPIILVVEDTSTERNLISALLVHAGFKNEAVSSAEDAWEWLENNPLPDLIILDIIMQGETGLDLCRKIRNNPQWEKVPILFCSSKSEAFDRFWALRQGGSDYITKPFAPQEFLDTITRHVHP